MHSVGRHVVMKMNKLKLHTTTWINLTSIKLNKRSKSGKNMFGKILFMYIHNQAKVNCVVRDVSIGVNP